MSMWRGYGEAAFANISAGELITQSLTTVPGIQTPIIVEVDVLLAIERLHGLGHR